MATPAQPLGSCPDEQLAIPGVVAAMEAILRQPRRVMFQLRQSKSGSLIAMLVLIATVCSLSYGVVVGTFAGGQQLWSAPIKIVVGLLLSALVCLPSLHIFSCLSGSPARLLEVGGLLAGLVALMAVLLIGFAPVAWIFSRSTDSIPAMTVLHLMFWLVAVGFGVRFLHSGFANLSIASLGGLKIWLVIFVLVQLQMMTALRPLLGTADTFISSEKKFFLKHWTECLTSSASETPNRR
jgi:hypothetical protein